MPSGKKSKQARRAAAVTAPPPVRSRGNGGRRRPGATPPPVVSKGSGTRRRQADPRVLWIAAGVVGIVVLAIVLAVVFTRGGSTSASNLPVTGSLQNALPGSAEIADELKGIPQQGMSLGNPKAPVTLTEYIDLQCPICREFETATMPDILTNYVRTGKLRIETRVLQFIGPDSLKARNAMLAAAKQNKAYNFALVLYANQGTENTGWLTDNMLGQIASSVPGLRVRQLWADRNSSAVKDLGAKFDAQGQADKVPGTPTLYVGKTGTKGHVVNIASADDYKTLANAIDQIAP